ncbi:MAG: ECF-type sigma factor [Acidobacteriota bacterium]
MPAQDDSAPSPTPVDAFTGPAKDSIDALLDSWNRGSGGARDALAEAIYPELRRLAAARIAEWSGDVSIQATELAHEAYFKLIDQRRTRWKNEAQLFAVLSRLIRRLLVDHYRRRSRQKRGGGAEAITLDTDLLVGDGARLDVLALDRALAELSAIDDVAVQVVEVLFFSGLTHDEAGPALGLGRATVGRKWRFARAWLSTRLAP